MAEAKIFRVIREQREAVNRDETALLRELARRWVPSYRFLVKQIEDLVKTVTALRDKGEPVPLSYVHSLDRYRKMADAAFRQIDRYNQAAAKVIAGAEADAQEIGSGNARQLISLATGDSPIKGLSPTIAVPTPDDPMWTRVNTRETRILSGMMSEGSPLYQLLRKSYAQTMDEIDKALTIGMSTGQGSAWIARQLSEAANVPLERALVIARTEVNRAYREANLETMRESRAVKGYRRMCYPPTACFACLMLDGEYYDKLESFSDHPNGKCSAVPVTKHFDPINSPDWERGQDWFAKQDEATQRKLMGAGRFDLWKQGGVDPRDMVYIKPNDVWGGSPAVRTLKEMIQTSAAVNNYRNNTKMSARKITDQGIVVNPMDEIEYSRMKSALEQQGIEVFAATEGDDLRYMLWLGAEGTYSNGRITHIGEIPSRGTFFEEIIHMAQSRQYGELDSTDAIELYAREIEANRKLLRYNKAYRLDDADIADVKRNLSVWESNYLQATGQSYDESTYRRNH